jgi:hypothetical protein
MQMVYKTLTELTILVHFAFIIFVVIGGFLVYRRRWLMIPHIMTILWAVYAELAPGIICPLTSLENYFALRAGIGTYEEDFVARYLIPLIYQENLTPSIQFILAVIVVFVNIIAYIIIWRKTSVVK